LRIDFRTRHPGEGRGPVRLSDCFHGYHRYALDSGFRRNDEQRSQRRL